MKLEKIIKDQPNLFWLIHLGVWSIWGSFKFFYTTAILDESIPHYATYVTIVTAIAVLISLGLRYLYRFLWDRAVWLQAIAFLGGSALAGWVWIKIRGFIYYGWFEQAKDMAAWYAEIGEEAARIYDADPENWARRVEIAMEIIQMAIQTAFRSNVPGR